MVFSTEPGVELGDFFEMEHDEAIVYADMEGKTVLHEGAVRVHVNGWVELPSGRLLSPEAVHHVDPQSSR